MTGQTEAGRAPRPLRYLHFTVPGWSDLHDQVIDESPETILSMRIVIDRSHSPVEVFCAEPPELYKLTDNVTIRRWHMFAALLCQPRLSGYWKEWYQAAYWLSRQRSLPLKLKMRVIDKKSFEQRASAVDDGARLEGRAAVAP